MTITEDEIAFVMNSACSFLEKAGVPVTPTTQYHMLGMWAGGFEDRDDPASLKMSTVICIAMVRLSHHVNPISMIQS